MKHIAILIFDGVEELDAVGPWEVLAWWTQNHPEDGYTVSLVSSDGAPVTAAKGLVLTPHTSVADAPPVTVFLHPGGHGTRALASDPAHLEWVRSLASTTELMTSVCTGSLVFAAAGLLRDRPATTYWSSFDALLALDPTIEARRDDRWVDDGDIVTSAGVSAGIDMALHLVRRFVSVERASEVKRGIQYDPQPPVD
ncbi:DJ-1/PfpI family protein [Marisediminicola sp. LYQ134]|uniref:DJ-1/PfpI family protein n=1 Tax=unclassified Marisediminicola TaxID=2618316 RepID=UPI003983AADD